MRTKNWDRTSMQSGALAESMLEVEMNRRAWEAYRPSVDTGVDMIVATPDCGKDVKRVQIAIGSQQHPDKPGYIISKTDCHIRDDVDIIALYIEEGNNWFIFPTQVYISAMMQGYYSTKGTTFYININKLKPPMDAALNAFWVFNEKNLNSKAIERTFFP
tara:strand:- start:180 stop:659 length:480 start_codon:yes stop_codon:yes gene_type:complete